MVDTTHTPSVRELQGSTDYGRFQIEPLEPGFGTTLGNSLRRVLLSSLTGAAVTSVSIEGVSHEFSTLPHVKEDVTEILLNIKGLNVISHVDEPVRMTLDAKGPRQVCARDIEPTSDVEICNPDLHICTLDGPQAVLRMDLTVERGKGYVPAERNKKEGQPIGVIPIDAIFTPVRKANFSVAVQPVSQVRGNDLPSRLADVPVEELELSVRALNCLKANDVTRIGQLVAMRQEELLSLRNFGQKSLDEIREKLVERGFVTTEELETLFQPAR